MCDFAVITNRNYSNYIVAGFSAAGGDPKRLLVEEDVTRAVESLAPKLGPTTVMVFEGRGPEQILHRLLGQL